MPGGGSGEKRWCLSGTPAPVSDWPGGWKLKTIRSLIQVSDGWFVQVVASKGVRVTTTDAIPCGGAGEKAVVCFDTPAPGTDRLGGWNLETLEPVRFENNGFGSSEKVSPGEVRNNLLRGRAGEGPRRSESHDDGSAFLPWWGANSWKGPRSSLSENRTE